MKLLLTLLVVASPLAWAAFGNTAMQDSKDKATETKSVVPGAKPGMQFGAFSVSLAVKDIKASKAFYEKLDFKQVHGKLEQNWLIMQNGTTTIGLFQGQFDKNIITFNPGWTHKMETVKGYEDVRSIQSKIKERGIEPIVAADESTEGPAYFMISDPDGNQILFDQHVPEAK